MLQEKFSPPVSPRQSRFWLLVSLISAIVLVFSHGIQPASAVPIEPPEHTPPVDPGEPPFVPYSGGFDWSVPDRFGRDDNQDGLIDYHWDSVAMQYDKSLLYPDVWPMLFDGCRTEQDAATGVSTVNTYTWQLDGETVSGNKCRFTYKKDSPNAGNRGFTAQGTYPVDLTVTYNDGSGKDPESFHQDVVVRDILIVSLGDSYASGEGNPDIAQRWHIEWGFMVKDADPVWEDKRCHRSAKAGSAQAALAIERMDPKTSVTFLSFACAGATVGTELFDANLLGWPDANKSRGVGLLEPYLGSEPPAGFPYSSRAAGWVGYIPSQMTQLTSALVPPTGKTQRQVDSLIISGGGNDMHFADIVRACLLYDHCYYDQYVVMESPTYLWTITPKTAVDRALARTSGRPNDNVPYYYDRLADAINNIQPAPAHVYLTQYPDLTRDDNGGYCRMLDDIFWPNPAYAITPSEAQAAATDALGDLNAKIFLEAKERVSQGWVYVDGLARYKRNDDDPNGADGLFNRHGYCASDNWIRRADESELIEGPLYWRKDTQGTAHPNYSGHQAYKQRLLYYMVPNLFPQPTNPPVISAPIYAISDLVDVSGTNGWYTGSCQAGACSPKVVLQVVGTAEAGVAGAGVELEGANACAVNGVTCRTDGGLSADKKQYTWNIELSADGIYNFQFNLRDSAGATASGGAEIKVALHDPVLIPTGPFTVNEGGEVTLEASVEDNQAGPVSYVWDLNNDGTFETYDQKPTFSAASLDGPSSQLIKVKAIDQAGRTSTGEAAVNVVNVAPTPTIKDVPTSNPEGTAINLSSAVSDPGVTDTFTYAWSVKKDGIDIASGTNTSFSFTPDDNGTYLVSLRVTDDDGGAGSTSQTITVTNVAPVLSNMQYSPTTVNEGGSVTVSGSITDPGKDSLTLTINWGDGSVEDTQSLSTGASSFTASHIYADDNPTGTAADANTITVKVTDKDAASDTETSSVTIDNLSPSVTLTAPISGTLYKVNDTVNVTGTVTDPSASDTLSCSVNWADGSTSSGTLASGTCSASHIFTAAGVYIIQLTGTDDDNGSDIKSVMVVVYDPSAGFVTGGGWIDSKAGAYKADPELAGQAHFGFVSRYEKGATQPTGRTQFQFRAGDLTFTSNSYEWLVVNQSGTNAQFKGSGMIDGAPDPNGNPYKFMLWAGDGTVNNGVDTFRIRIWWEDAAGEHDVYDNGVNQPIDGGSIVVHSK